MIRLLVVDDHAPFRAAVEVMCVADGEVEVVAEAASIDEALAALDTDPDLVLLDVNLGGVDGVAGARMIRQLHPELPVVLCSTAPLPELPPLPRDPAVTFVPKQDLDPRALRDRYAAWRSTP